MLTLMPILYGEEMLIFVEGGKMENPRKTILKPRERTNNSTLVMHEQNQTNGKNGNLNMVCHPSSNNSMVLPSNIMRNHHIIMQNLYSP
jgi:hypothetical protein